MSAGARPSAFWSLVKTIVLLVVLWGIVVFAVPIGISVVEIELGLQRFPTPPTVAGALLLISTLIGLWAAITLAIRGRGTPLPLDPPHRLVIEGPYAFVRHPFALAMLGQMAAIALAMGSAPVSAYVVLSAVVWQFVIRPREEKTLEQRFGSSWRRYCRNVHALRPRLTPYHPRWTDPEWQRD